MWLRGRTDVRVVEAGCLAATRRRLKSSWIWLTMSALVCACGAVAPAFPSLRPQTGASGVSIAGWAQCLRNHGVTVPAGYDPYSPPPGSAKLDVTDTAEAACASLLPPNPQQPSASGDKFLAWARCMRSRGIPAPDPTVLADGNVVETLPDGVGPAMPGFNAAAAACGTEAGLPDLVPAIH
jgi:hypothetical protein